MKRSRIYKPRKQNDINYRYIACFCFGATSIIQRVWANLGNLDTRVCNSWSGAISYGWRVHSPKETQKCRLWNLVSCIFGAFVKGERFWRIDSGILGAFLRGRVPYLWPLIIHFPTFWEHLSGGSLWLVDYFLSCVRGESVMGTALLIHLADLLHTGLMVVTPSCYWWGRFYASFKGPFKHLSIYLPPYFSGNEKEKWRIPVKSYQNIKSLVNVVMKIKYNFVHCVVKNYTWVEFRITNMYVRAMSNGDRKPNSHVTPNKGTSTTNALMPIL